MVTGVVLDSSGGEEMDCEMLICVDYDRAFWVLVSEICLKKYFWFDCHRVCVLRSISASCSSCLDRLVNVIFDDVVAFSIVTLILIGTGTAIFADAGEVGCENVNGSHMKAMADEVFHGCAESLRECSCPSMVAGADEQHHLVVDTEVEIWNHVEVVVCQSRDHHVHLVHDHNHVHRVPCGECPQYLVPVLFLALVGCALPELPFLLGSRQSQSLGRSQ